MIQADCGEGVSAIGADRRRKPSQPEKTSLYLKELSGRVNEKIPARYAV
jgi:hypothetical protein